MLGRKTAIGAQLSVLGHQALYSESRKPLPAESRKPKGGQPWRYAACCVSTKSETGQVEQSEKDEVEAYPSTMCFSDSYSALENTVRGDTVGQ